VGRAAGSQSNYDRWSGYSKVGLFLDKTDPGRPPFSPRIQVFHEYLEQAMASLASENAVVATALHNGSMA
jgi:hypothetical protein